MEKVYDVVELSVNPPESAVVVCVDEISPIRADVRGEGTQWRTG